MQVSRIQSQYFTNYNNNISAAKNRTNNITSGEKPAQTKFATIPAGFKYNANIHFGEFFDPNRTIPHIDYEEYMAMKETTKKRFRKKYKNFFNDPAINTQEMIDKKYLTMPLQSETLMNEFLKTAKFYSKFKDQTIICLGRSPKWFLNAALWMKDGIENYRPVAFSKNWYRYDTSDQSLIRIDSMAPTPKEEVAYRKYLKRIKADPQTIVDNMKETGKKTVITDYIYSGKGMTSFLDVMSKYAEDLGILEDFCKSIHIVGIGSKSYMEDMMKVEEAPTPKVIMPERMVPFEKTGLWTYNITQEFHNMDLAMFKEMLINQNTNECRSTYYPHETWTVYKPDRFKTGLIKDMKKVKEMVKELKSSGEKSMSSFTPAMYDYRNLLNFRILDALNERGLLKLIHKSKV